MLYYSYNNLNTIISIIEQYKIIYHVLFTIIIIFGLIIIAYVIEKAIALIELFIKEISP